MAIGCSVEAVSSLKIAARADLDRTDVGDGVADVFPGLALLDEAKVVRPKDLVRDSPEPAPGDHDRPIKEANRECFRSGGFTAGDLMTGPGDGAQEEAVALA